MTDWTEMVWQIRQQDEQQNAHLDLRERAQQTNERCRAVLNEWNVIGSFASEPLRHSPELMASRQTTK